MFNCFEQFAEIHIYEHNKYAEVIKFISCQAYDKLSLHQLANIINQLIYLSTCVMSILQFNKLLFIILNILIIIDFNITSKFFLLKIFWY